MSDNFWGFFIGAWTQMFTSVLSVLPDSQFNYVIGATATTLYYGLAPLLFFVGPFFNLNFLFIVIGVMLVCEIVKNLIGLGRLIGKVLEAVAVIIKLLPFFA